MYELTISDEFEAAHRLPDYNGKCCRLHGHNWKVEVCVRGEKLGTNGMLVDFKDLKEVLASVLNKLDHYYLNETPPFDTMPPTAENLARYVFDSISHSSVLPVSVYIFAVRVWESPRSCASYIPNVTDLRGS
jgi:6-pyruvoyltetrahydropterin/6-carboxytetrahydropterin synthase